MSGETNIIEENITVIPTTYNKSINLSDIKAQAE
jgi:hypothetical protein